MIRQFKFHRKAEALSINRAAKHRAGFTLLELMIVMALLTITVGLAIPRLASFFRGRALDSEGRRILAFTRYAQERAVSEGIPMRVWFDSRSGRCGIERDPSYDMEDTEALEFEINSSIRVEVTSPKRLTATTTRPGTSTRPTADSPFANFPAMRFLPDGTIEETSPERVTLWDADDRALILERSRNRLNYELSNR